jgi:hypothetical protein
MMLRYDLTAPATKENMKTMVIDQLHKINVFVPSEERNQWIDWDGNTSLVERFDHMIFLTWDEAVKRRDSKRKQGSRLTIYSLPALACVSNEYCFVVVFSNTANLDQYMRKIAGTDDRVTIADIDNDFQNNRKVLFSGSNFQFTFAKDD